MLPIIEVDPEDIWEDDAAASFPIVLFETMKELPLYAEQRGLDFAKLISEIASPDVKGILESQLGDEAMPESVSKLQLKRIVLTCSENGLLTLSLTISRPQFFLQLR